MLPGWDHDLLLASGFVLRDVDHWKKLNKTNKPKLLIKAIEGIYDALNEDELDHIFSPLIQFVADHFHRHLSACQQHASYLLGSSHTTQPFVIGLAGSVSVGKSTCARLLQAWLSQHLSCQVEILTTDHFLYPNHVLQDKGITDKKGFPESYRIKALMQCLLDMSMNHFPQHVPYYSHLYYDIMKDQQVVVPKADILILEGLNVLQLPKGLNHKMTQRSVSDFIHLGLFLDAREQDLLHWFKSRLLLLCEKAKSDQQAYLYPMSQWPIEKITTFAGDVWQQINHVNLVENILPSRLRAQVILQKNQRHRVEAIWIRH